MFKLVLDDRISDCMTYPVGRNMENVNDYLKVYAEIIKNHVSETETINLLCRGSSGAIISGILSSLLPEYKTVITHVKKEGENAHANYVDTNPDYYNIIVDDFVSSGHTVSSINDRYLEEGGTKVHMLLVSGCITTYQEINFLETLEILACGRVSPSFQEEYNIEIKLKS